MSDEKMVSTKKRFLMQKGKNTLIITLIIIILVLLFPYVASLFEGNNTKTKTISLDNYELGYMIESGDFMLWNRKTNEMEYCIKDSLSKLIHFQIMKVDKLEYDILFDKKGEKK